MQTVIEWSQDKPDWWKDAIRRIMTKEEITENDILDLTALCKNENRIEDTELEPNTISVGEIEVDAGQESVSLTGVKNIQNINALDSGQSLDLQVGGLNVIFGRNGSGKSGYARILKRSCRVRGNEETILPNIFLEEGERRPQEATILYNEGGNEKEFIWENGIEPPSELEKVSVFDSKAIVPYIDNETDIAYRPWSLVVLSELATVCHAVKENLYEERERVRQNKIDIEQYEFHEGTETFDIIDNLSSDTSKENLKELAELEEEEVKRLSELKEIERLHGKDAQKKIREMERKAKSFERIYGEILALSKVLNQDNLAKLKETFEKLKRTEKAADEVSQDLSEEQPLSGIGSDIWKKLWRYSKEYSEEIAYPDESFPYTGEEARCVLCQQPLSEEAKERLLSFEEYIEGRIQTEVDKLKEELRNQLEPIEKLNPHGWLGNDDLERLKDTNKEVYLNVKSYLERLGNRRRKALEDLSSQKFWEELPEIPETELELKEVINKIIESARELEKTHDEEKIDELKCNMYELEDRKKLASNLSTIISEIDRLSLEKKLDKAIDSANTRSITDKSKEIAENISPRLKEKFNEELNNLGIETLELDYEKTGGKRGNVYHQLQLADSANDEVVLSQVLSEGEQRCIALANFLTELSTAEHNSSIIFDDPVSSLDHRWRKQVAERLTKEATKRQVVVFTHELVFLLRLKNATAKEEINMHFQTIKRIPGGTTTGIVDDDLPTEIAKPKRRLGQLKSRIQNELRGSYKTEEEYKYERKAALIIDELRSSCEGIIAKRLLNNVVERFGLTVHTQQIDRVEVKEEDVNFVNYFMSECSELIKAHHAPSRVNRPIPDPDSIMEMANGLDDWRKELCQR